MDADRSFAKSDPAGFAGSPSEVSSFPPRQVIPHCPLCVPSSMGVGGVSRTVGSLKPPCARPEALGHFVPCLLVSAVASVGYLHDRKARPQEKDADSYCDRAEARPDHLIPHVVFGGVVARLAREGGFRGVISRARGPPSGRRGSAAAWSVDRHSRRRGKGSPSSRVCWQRRGPVDRSCCRRARRRVSDSSA